MDSDKITSFRVAREQLQKWREDHERKSEEVVTLWLNVICNNEDKLGDEKWMVLEQVVIAALDTHDYGLAGDTICELKSRFPSSDRVRYLQVLRLQAMEKYEEALAALDQMISKDATNSAAYKQKIAILKSQGNLGEAVKALTEYLNKFMSDQEAWSELCDLYLSEGEYARAIYCAEELILHNPHNFFVYQRAGDIRYTMGGIDNLKIAFNYYNQAIKLNENSMRSLFGLFLVGSYYGGGVISKMGVIISTENWAGSSLTANSKVPLNDRKDFAKSTAWAADDIHQRYHAQGEGPDPVDLMLEGAMKNLQITS